MKILIVAAGLATRLKPLTNYIPKFLVNIGKDTGFVTMINYWRQYSSEFAIIIHSSFIPITQAYWDLYYKNSGLTLTLIPCDEAIGTANTISKYAPDHYDDSDVLVTWSDIVPESPLELPQHPYKTLIFSHGDKCRYKILGWPDSYKVCEMPSGSGGDVIGIFLFSNFNRKLIFTEIGNDICDVLAESGNFKPISVFEVDSMIDFGDMNKLDNLLNKVDGSREFNEIFEITSEASANLLGHELLLKRSRQPQGIDLIKNEISWYQTVDMKYRDLIPKIYTDLGKSQFMMEKISGSTVYDAFERQPLKQEIILKNILDTLAKLHQTELQVPTDILIRDVKYEAFDKLVSRISEIQPMIDAFGGAPKNVNGVDVLEPQAAIQLIYSMLIEEYSKIFKIDLLKEPETDGERRDRSSIKYSMIHGDPQFSNTMLDDNQKIIFIDPRGYFGKTKNYGLPDYDLAKVLYSLSGYDNFNRSKKFHLSYLQDGRVGFELVRPDFSIDLSKYFARVHYLWLAVIWIGLAQYIKNNPIKSYAALSHGLYLVANITNNNLGIK